MQPLTAVAEAARIALTFVLLSLVLVVVSIAGITWWAVSSLVDLFSREPAPVVRPVTSRRG